MTRPPSPTDRLTEIHVVAWARMARATHTVLQAVEAALKRHGLPSLSWYDLLLELYRARPQGLRPVRLQAEMLMPQSNMSRLIDRVENAGCIRRSVCDDDGRGQVVEITDAGEDMLRRMWPVYRHALREAFAGRIGTAAAADLSAALHPFRAQSCPKATSVPSADGGAFGEGNDIDTFIVNDPSQI